MRARLTLLSIVLLSACGSARDERTIRQGMQVTPTPARSSFDASALAAWPLDEGAGQAVRDATGNGHDAFLGESPDADSRDPSWAQDGSLACSANGYIAVPSSKALEGAHVSVEAWIKIDTAQPDRYALSYGHLDQSDRSSSESYGLWVGGESISFSVRTEDGGTYAPAKSNPAWNGTWHHVVGTYDGAFVRLFVDGEEIDHGSPLTGPVHYSNKQPNHLFLGSDLGDGSTSFTGSMSRVAIYGEALTRDQIVADYAAGLGTLPSATLPFDTVLSNTDGAMPPRGDGALAVTDRGDAQYHIPIGLPPGRNGVQPDLSLEYSSSAGNGLYGVGWKLNGLPRIARCRNLRADGNVAPPVVFDSTDGFCLDGQALLPTNAAHTEFHTLRDDFSRITILGSDDKGPTSFEQRTKDGKILTFGGTADARVERTRIGASTVRAAWAISRSEDRSGNFYRVSYKGTEGDIVADRIDYTGSSTDPTTARSVTFIYEDTRKDVDTAYLSGTLMRRRSRLVRLEMRAPNARGLDPLRTFSLQYATSGLTGRSLLSGVSECDGPPNASPAPLCRAASFDYSQGTNAFSDIAVDSTGAPIAIEVAASSLIRLLDINGDGKDDLLYRLPNGVNHYHTRLAAVNGFGPDEDTGIPGGLRFGPDAVDYNGDGHADLVLGTVALNGAVPLSYLYLAHKAADGSWHLGNDAQSVRSLPSAQQIDPTDLNGDRYPDLLLNDSLAQIPTDGGPRARTELHYVINDHGAVDTIGPLQTFPRQLTPDYVPIDLNGDGATELLAYDGPSGVCSDTVPDPPRNYTAFDVGLHLFGNPSLPPGPVWTDNTTLLGPDVCVPRPHTVLDPQTHTKEVFILPSWERISFADLNGDGVPDAVSAIPDRGGAGTLNPHVLQVAEGRGAQEFVSLEGTLSFISTASTSIPSFRSIDVNEDGKAELIVRFNNQLFPIRVLTVSPFLKDGTAHDNLVPVSPIPVGVDPDSTTLDHTDQTEVGDINGDGIEDIVLVTNGKLHVYMHQGDKSDLLTGVSGTIGPHSTVTYKPLSAGPDPSGDCKLPIQCVTAGRWVVDTHNVDDGVGGMNVFRHIFEYGRADALEWGFLGFKTHTIVDQQSGTITKRTFDFTPSTTGHVVFYPLAPLLRTETTTNQYAQTTVDGATTIRVRVASRDVTYGLTGTGPFAVLPSRIEEKTIDRKIDGSASTTIADHVVFSQIYDAFGNVLSRGEQWPLDGITETTATTYQNRPDVWLVSLPRLRTVVSKMDIDGRAIPRRTGFEFDDRGRLFRKIDEPGSDDGTSFAPLSGAADGVQTLYTQYDYNADGLIVRTTTADHLDGTGEARVDTTTYDDAERMFPVSTRDALQHESRTAYEPGLGMVALRIDPNGVITRYQYDGFGRLRAERPSTGDDHTISYLAAASSWPNGATHDVTASGADTLTRFDSLGRAIQTTTIHPNDGKSVDTTTEYDNLGRAYAVSRPFFEGATPAKTTTSFDALGRPILVKYADGTFKKTAYEGLRTTVRDTTGATRRVTTDSVGHTLVAEQWVDATRSIATKLAYGPFGVLESVTDPAGNRVFTQFDRKGRPRIQTDGDVGARLFTYNAFGEVTQDVRGGVTDGTTVTGGRAYTMKYDPLGRVTQTGGPDATQTQVWDTAEHGIGKLASVSFASGPTVTYAYDDAARVRTKAWGSVAVRYTYDAVNRLDTTSYPEVAGQDPLIVKNGYDAGRLVRVSDATSGVVYWRMTASDASNAFLSEEMGSGAIDTVASENAAHPGWLDTIVSHGAGTTIRSLKYTYDGREHLRERDDLVAEKKDQYDYDLIHRLTRWTASTKTPGGWQARTLRYDYDDIGNLTGKIVEAGAGTSATFAYGAFGPHQPASTEAGAFSYDAIGRQTGAPGRTVAFDDFDLPDALTTADGVYSFTYDGELHRSQRTDPSGHVRQSFGDLYERYADEAGTHHVFTIKATRPIAELEVLEGPEGPQPARATYLLADHLGSIDTLVDAAGVVLQRIAYEPFGLRVQSDDASQPLAAPPNGVRKGFTGHTHDDDLRVIDMGGRVFDPVQQRFLSRDPASPDWTDSRALNLYGYVRNNPLSAIDPTGFMEVRLGDGTGDGVYWSHDAEVAIGFTGDVTLHDVPSSYERELAKDSQPKPLFTQHSFIDSLSVAGNLAGELDMTSKLLANKPGPVLNKSTLTFVAPSANAIANMVSVQLRLSPWQQFSVGLKVGFNLYQKSISEIAQATESHTRNLTYGSCLSAALLNLYVGAMNGYDGSLWVAAGIDRTGKATSHAMAELRDDKGSTFMSWGKTYSSIAPIANGLWVPGWSARDVGGFQSGTSYAYSFSDWRSAPAWPNRPTDAADPIWNH
jgi:RHS repeat-associated protein